MAQCCICNKILPPGYTNPTEDNKAAKCLFCERETDTLTLQNPENGLIQTYTKQQVADEYMKYLRQIKENPDVKKLIVDDAVNSMKQNM